MEVNSKTLVIVVLLKRLLLADSICKYTGDLPGVDQKVIWGAYFETFVQKVNAGEIIISGIDAVLIQVGTNNMAQNYDPRRYWLNWAA